jgi:hypothetical protein
MSPPRTGVAAVVVDALVERLTLLGAGSDDPRVAKLLQEAWEDNDLDVMHREAHREALIKRRSFGSGARLDRRPGDRRASSRPSRWPCTGRRRRRTTSTRR